jgi:hypothetical protein
MAYCDSNGFAADDQQKISRYGILGKVGLHALFSFLKFFFLFVHSQLFLSYRLQYK